MERCIVGGGSMNDGGGTIRELKLKMSDKGCGMGGGG